MFKQFQKASLATAAALTFITPALAQESDAAGGIFGLLIICCVFLFIVLYLGLKVYLTIDCLNRNYGEDKNGKVLGLVLIWVVDWIISPLGLILYYFLVMRKYPKNK